MTGDVSAVLSHISIGTNDFEKARAFYDTVLAVFGCTRQEEFPGGVAYGKQFPEFYVQEPIDGQPASVGNGSHISFFATSREQVQQFYETALRVGATPEGAPGPRPDYGAPYYGCFVRDLDGHKIEATYWNASAD